MKNDNKAIFSSDPNILVRRSGGGCLAVFGTPFFLAGLFALQSPLNIIPLTVEEQPMYGVALVGMLFTLVGGIFILGRTGLIIDRGQGVMTRWWGLLVPIIRKESSLADYKTVRLSKEIRGNNGNTTYFPVRLHDTDEAKPASIYDSNDYQLSRKAAEELAKFLSLPIEDLTSGVSVTREPDKLDESLRDKARREGDGADFLSQPPDCRSNIYTEGRSVVVEIPAPGIGKAGFIKMFIPLLFLGFVFYFFLSGIISFPMPLPVRFIFLAFFLFVFVLGPLATVLRKGLPGRSGKVRVTASRDGLSVEEFGLIRSKATEIPASELEEFIMPGSQIPAKAWMQRGRGAPQEFKMPEFLNPVISRLFVPPGIIARSDRVSVEFGKGLSEEEKKYIHMMIKKVITE